MMSWNILARQMHTRSTQTRATNNAMLRCHLWPVLVFIVLFYNIIICKADEMDGADAATVTLQPSRTEANTVNPTSSPNILHDKARMTYTKRPTNSPRRSPRRRLDGVDSATGTFQPTRSAANTLNPTSRSSNVLKARMTYTKRPTNSPRRSPRRKLVTVDKRTQLAVLASFQPNRKPRMKKNPTNQRPMKPNSQPKAVRSPTIRPHSQTTSPLQSRTSSPTCKPVSPSLGTFEPTLHPTYQGTKVRMMYTNKPTRSPRRSPRRM